MRRNINIKISYKKVMPDNFCICQLKFIFCRRGVAGLILLLALILIFSFCSRQTKIQKTSTLPGNPYLLPNGWTLSPAGREINLGGLPLNIISVSNTHYAVVASDDYTDHFLTLIDVNTDQVVNRQLIKQGWMGLAASNDGKRIYASAGGRDSILVFNIENERPKPASEIPVPKGTFPTGLELSPDNKYLYTTGNHNNSFLQINLSTNQVV